MDVGDFVLFVMPDMSVVARKVATVDGDTGDFTTETPIAGVTEFAADSIAATSALAAFVPPEI